jgi:hypothetical protein
MKQKRNPVFSLCLVLIALLVFAVTAVAGESPGKFTLNVSAPNAIAVVDNRVALARVDPVVAFKLTKDLAVEAYSVKLQDPEPQPMGWAGAYVFRLTGDKEDRASCGALRNITPLTGVAGKFTLNLDGYAGLSLRKSVPVAALLLGAKFKLADQVDLSAHAGATIAGGQPTGLAIGVSAFVRFNTK